MNAVLPFILGLVVAMSLLPTLVGASGWLRLLDAPGGRKVHSTPVPRVGGIAIAVGVLAAVSSSSFTLDNVTGTFLIGAFVIFVFGVLDDRFDLDYRIKLAGQLLACGIPVLVGGMRIDSIEIFSRNELPVVVSTALTMLFMVGVTNAVNMTDGLDGLAGGTVFLCLCALAWLAFGAEQPVLLWLCLGFAGATLGFLRFNTHPATVFMGDAGSQLLGYAIGGLSVLSTQESVSPVSASLPVLLLGLPILDTAQVMVRRVAAGGSPFRADKGHLHHRLLARGFEHHEAVMIIYVAQALLLLVAYGERFQSDGVILLTYAVFSAASLGVLWLAERNQWMIRDDGNQRAGVGVLSRVVGGAYERGAPLRVGIGAMLAGIAAYAVITVAGINADSPDIRISLTVMSLSMLALLLWRRRAELGLLDKAVLYSIVAAFVYCETDVESLGLILARLNWGAVLVVALATVVALRSGAKRGFAVTPLDLLVLFVTLVVPNLPAFEHLPGVSPMRLGKVIVLFYALEVLVSVPGFRPAWIRVVGAGASSVLLLAILWAVN